MRTIVAGSRDYDNWATVKSILDRCPWKITEVVCGEARGPDLLGRKWAESRDVKVASFPAQWNRQQDGSYDRSAGHKRNREMAKYAEACVVFWDGKSEQAAHDG